MLTSLQVVNSVLCINPGTLSKRRGAGTYTALSVQAKIPTNEEREKGDALPHEVYERARVDVVRI